MIKLSAKTIGIMSKGFFAFLGLSVLGATYFTGGSGIETAFSLFGLSLLPTLLPFRLIAIVYGILAFMVFLCGLCLYTAANASYGFGPDFWTVALLYLFLFSGILASAGLIYASTSLDKQRFTLI